MDGEHETIGIFASYGATNNNTRSILDNSISDNLPTGYLAKCKSKEEQSRTFLPFLKLKKKKKKQTNQWHCKRIAFQLSHPERKKKQQDKTKTIEGKVREKKKEREKREENGKNLAIMKSACTKRNMQTENCERMLGRDRREGRNANETARSAAGIILITELTAVGRFLSANSLSAGRVSNTDEGEGWWAREPHRTHERNTSGPGAFGLPNEQKMQPRS